jgi:protease-4
MKRLGFFVLFCSAGALLPGCFIIPIGDLLKPLPLQEQTLIQGEGYFTQEKIAVVDVDGMLTGDESSSLLLPHENSVAEIKARFDRIRLDPEVRAVVLRISSPGGEVTACDVLHQELQRFKKEASIPVIASIGDQGTSGAYYVAVGADVILAHPTAVVGSIGVLLQHVELAGLLEKIGVVSNPVKSSEKKDLSSILRPMTPEERAILQKLVDDMYVRFVDVVAAGRPALRRDEVLALADGRVVSGTEAVKLKLVDRLGYLPDAIDEAARRAGIDRPTVIRYTRLARSGANIYTEGGATRPSAGGLELTLRAGLAETPKLYYLWKPGW